MFDFCSKDSLGLIVVAFQIGILWGGFDTLCSDSELSKCMGQIIIPPVIGGVI